MTFGFVLLALRPMAAIGVLPEKVVIALAFAAAVAAMAVTGVLLGDGGGVGVSKHCSIDRGLLAVLKRSSEVQRACLVEATSISVV